MKLGSLCSGAGGLDLAVEAVFGAQTVWHCETDKAASKVLAHRWPGVPNHGDLITTDWAAVEPVDIVCAGWPCQPWSVAGKRKGHKDERAIWPHIAGAVRILRPRFVCLENVSAVLALGEFQRAASDLAALGYDLRWVCVRASDVGAPHQRERFFAIAHDSGFQGPRPGGHGMEQSEHVGNNQPATDTVGCRSGSGYVAAGMGRLDYADESPSRQRQRTWTDIIGGSAEDFSARSAGLVELLRDIECDTAWGRYETAIRWWEAVTRPAPQPTIPGAAGLKRPRLNSAFSEWMMGWPEGWVTDPQLGIKRNDQLKIIGNGCVPQQAAAALAWLLNIEVAA